MCWCAVVDRGVQEIERFSPQAQASFVRAVLIPIDHGYSMPDELEVAWCDWVWLDWPQTKIPFSKEAKVEMKKCLEAVT